MDNIEFKILSQCDDLIVVDEPIAVYRVVEHLIHGSYQSFIVDEYVEDPDVTDFLFVLKRDGSSHYYVCERDGIQYICQLISDIAPFSRFAIPLMRRTYPQLIANKLAAVQPMTTRSSLIHYLRHKYSSTKK